MGVSPTTSSRSRRSSRPGPRGSCRTTGCRSTSSSTASEIEPIGFGYNKQVVTGLLREKLGYDGVVVTDWELVNDNHVGDQVLPARAWGVEHLDPHGRMELILEAGADQFGGEECVEILLDLVAQGRVTEARVDESARRILAVKFRLGLFDDPYVDEDAAAATVGRGDFRERGVCRPGPFGDRAAQRGWPAPARAGPAHLRRAGLTRGGRAARQARRAARGRRRRRRAPHGALRPALRPLPRVVVPPGLARLPARPRRPARADRRGVPARRRRRARPAGRADPAAALRLGGRRQLRQHATTPCSTPSPAPSRPSVACRSTCRGRWTRCGRTARTSPATTTRSSRFGHGLRLDTE